MKGFFIAVITIGFASACPELWALDDDGALIRLAPVEDPFEDPEFTPAVVAESVDSGEVSLVSYHQALPQSTNYWRFGKLHSTRLGHTRCGEPTGLDYGVVARGFYLSDQRIQWSGLETTFAAEGALYGNYRVHSGNWVVSVENELFLNQRTDRNILIDTQERRSYLANYEYDPLELSRLNIALRNGDWEMRAGRMWSPFGRYYSQLWTNQFLDAPFIRTEAIRFRETGVMGRWDPGPWVVEAGIFNGHTGRDTNSSKALVARIGAEKQHWALGCSVKAHDGSGSEDQKTYSNHAGIDAMVTQGKWRLSTEVIYDQYGLRRATFDPLDIYWEKSIYFRDLNFAYSDPITGVGYYVAVDYEGQAWLVSLSYGQFFPKTIGDPRHDRTQHRGIIKVARSIGNHLQAYSVVMIENEGYIAQIGLPRRGTVVLAGLQFNF